MRPELGCGRSPGAVASGDLALGGGVCGERGARRHVGGAAWRESGAEGMSNWPLRRSGAKGKAGEPRRARRARMKCQTEDWLGGNVELAATF
jgi:hypothetical protein